MNKSDLLSKVIFDYRKFFYNDQVDEYKKEMSAFLNENKELGDDDFYKKFDEKFYTSSFIDKMLSRIYLSKISADVKVIKVIVVIYFIASIVGGFALAIQLTQ